MAFVFAFVLGVLGGVFATVALVLVRDRLAKVFPKVVPIGATVLTVVARHDRRWANCREGPQR
jgi:hypothetical protein